MTVHEFMSNTMPMLWVPSAVMQSRMCAFTPIATFYYITPTGLDQTTAIDAQTDINNNGVHILLPW
jgi:hypothetical protein